MQKASIPRSGDLIDLFDEGEIVCAVVVGEEKGRIKVVTETGKQIRVTASRVAHRAGAAGEWDAAGAALAHSRQVAARLDDIDLPVLWDLLVDEPARYDLGQLAALAFGEGSSVARSAMLRRLQTDRTYFVRKSDQYEPRPREHVDETLKREAAEKAAAARRSAFLTIAREALDSGPAAGPPEPGRLKREYADHVADLVELALLGEEAESRKRAIQILDEVTAPEGAPAERAFHLLRALGLFSEDENLFIQRFRLRTAFPETVENAALAACAMVTPAALLQAGRRDLRELTCFTIDDPYTTELDDALSLEPLDPVGRTGARRIRLGIHIADPGCYVRRDDPVDVEAMSRAMTYYFPDSRLPMLPACISEEAASLRSGVDTPALSFLVTLNEDAEILDSELVASVVRSRARLTYELVDALLEENAQPGPSIPPECREQVVTALRGLPAIQEALERRRVAAGAVTIRAPEIDIKVRSGEITVRRIDDRGPSRRIVSEAMILANFLAASYCVDRAIPGLFRRQAAPLEMEGDRTALSAADSMGGHDPVAVRALRRRMRRGEVGVTPGPHHGLGLAAYAQVTSPIRRYQDLVVQRQIEASLLGADLPYAAEALARIAATTEETERVAREAERGALEYWILEHYAARQGESVEAVIVVSEARRTEVELVDTLYSVTIPHRPDHHLGDRLLLRIEKSRPRAPKLVLREVTA